MWGRLDFNLNAVGKSLEGFKQSSDVIRFSCELEEKNHLWLFMHIRLMLDKTRGWETSEETTAKTQVKNEGGLN